MRRAGWREGDKVLPLNGIWEERGGGRRKTLREASVSSGGGRIDFYLVDFLRNLEMDANVAMIMEFMRSRSYIYINDHRKIRIAHTYTQTRSSVSFCTT